MHRVIAPRGHLQLDALSFWLRPPLPLPRVKTREAAYGVCMDLDRYLTQEGVRELDLIIDSHCQMRAKPKQTARALCNKIRYNDGFLLVPPPAGLDWRVANRARERAVAAYLNCRICAVGRFSEHERHYAAKVMSRTLWCLGSLGEIVNRKRLS